jgi:ABC-type Na+ efflux pump permease subunit
MAVVLFSPLIGASMISSERERGTWARLLSSQVSRNGIVLGKFVAACLYLMLLLTISFPLATLSLLYGGLEAITVGVQFRMRTTFPGSVYAAADEHRGEVMQRIVGWFNPIDGIQLFLGMAHGQRIDWLAHYAAMFALGGLALAIAMLRVRRATA